jgi:hypothetical protein
MKVYLAYECYDNECDIWKTVVAVFGTEAKAKAWVLEQKTTNREWREYAEMEVL